MKGHPMQTIDIAISNLLSVPVLAFVIGIVASRWKSPVQLPDAVYQGITIFLLLGIGLKGGHALRITGGADFLVPALAALAVGIVIPFIAFGLISLGKRFTSDDRASIAAHYGSTSLVTFSAGLVMLESLRVTVEPYVATLLAIMEIPGIIVGVGLGLWATRSKAGRGALREALREVFLGKTVVLLVGGLAVGFAAPLSSFDKVLPFFVDLQPGILVLFLLQLGAIVGARLDSLKDAGLWLPVFGIVMPIVGGVLGVVTGTAIGMSIGGATMLAVLTASASYIAAPAAVSVALPNANLGIALTASLGITFPFNLLVGLPLYLAISTALSG